MTEQPAANNADQAEEANNEAPKQEPVPAKRPEPQQPAPTRPPSSRVPQGPSWITILTVAAIVVITLWIGVMGSQPIRRGVKTVFELVGIGHGHTEHSVADESGQYYTCGMHPWVILPKPGNCPICRMELVPLDPDKFTGEVAIDPLVVQNIGVRIAPVVTGPLTRRIRTVGTVDYDETAVRDVNIKVPGWIEELYVDYLGAQVSESDRLFDFYSPDLYAAQEEYLLALKNIGKIGADFVPDAAKGAKELLEAARTRLLYFDITPEQIKELEKRGKPSKTLAILSPHQGVVISKHANEGMMVDQGMRVFRIADLTKVWVMVTLYEYQVPYVQLGQRAVMTLPYVPGQTFEGKVIYIYPYLDKKTREVQVRLEFDNPNGLLKPGMFANVALQSTLAKQRTLAPSEAIIDTGERQVAFVSLGEGKFEPRDIKTGVESGDGLVEILDGLKPGEMVVTSGQFLIDSEAKIREALAKMIRGESAADQQAVAAIIGASELSSLPDDVAAGLDDILNNYFAVGKHLADDTTEGIDTPAGKIAEAVESLLQATLPENPHFWHKHQEVASIRGKALELTEAIKLDQARLKFADLSVALDKLVRATGVPPAFGQKVQQLRCPMYRSGQGGTIWLQPAGDVRNPYYGSVMLECFDQRQTLPVTGDKASPEEVSRDQSAEPEQTASNVESASVPATQTLSSADQAQIDRITMAYLSIQRKLARDQHEGIAEDFGALRQAAGVLKESDNKWTHEAVRGIFQTAADQPQDIEQARLAFLDLSNAMVKLAQIAPPSEAVASELHITYCPMAKASWLQSGTTVSNPYYGQGMLRCGKITGAINALPVEKD